jgi:hypothetical protein
VKVTYKAEIIILTCLVIFYGAIMGFMLVDMASEQHADPIGGVVIVCPDHPTNEAEFELMKNTADNTGSVMSGC